MEFKGRKLLVFGLNGSGKTEWVKAQVRKNFKQPLIWCNEEHKPDWIKEKGFLYSPKGHTDAEIKEELNDVIDGIKRVNNSPDYKHYDVVIFDDFDSVVNSQTLSYQMKDINANNRVWDELCLIFIIRRPEQLNTNITETCHYFVAFAIEGENTLNKLRSISKDFEEKVRQLKFKDYRAVIKPQGYPAYFEEPVKLK